MIANDDRDDGKQISGNRCAAFDQMMDQLASATEHLWKGDEWQREGASAWSSDWIGARGDHWRAQAVVREIDTGYQGGVATVELGHDVSVHWSGIRPGLEAAKTEAKDGLKSWLSARDTELTHHDRSYRGWVTDVEINKAPPPSETMAYQGAAYTAMVKATDAMLARCHAPSERWAELERNAAMAMRAARKAFAAERKQLGRSLREQHEWARER